MFLLLIVYIDRKKTSGKYNRDIIQRENVKCRKDCIVLKGTDSNNETLECVLQFKGEAKEVINKIVKYHFYLLAHNGSGFDIYVVLINLPHWGTVVSLMENASGVVSFKSFNGYVDENKKIPQYVHYICGRVHINLSLKKVGVSYIFQPNLLKQEIDHYEINEDSWEDEEHEWISYLKNDVFSTAFSYARYAKGMEKLTWFGRKNSFTLPSLAKRFFDSLRDENDEPIYSYND